MTRLRALLLTLALVLGLLTGAATIGPSAPTADAATATTWTSYSGKGKGKLVVGRSWKALDVRSGTPPFAGIEAHLLYLNLQPTWKKGKTQGVCRVMYRRDKHGKQAADPTGYADFSILKSALIGKRFLITHVHEEVGQKGRNGRWYIRCGGGIKRVSIGTRYDKASVVR